MKHASRLSKRSLVIVIGLLVFLLVACNRLTGDSSPIALPTPTPTPADPRFEAYHGLCTTYGVAYEDPGENAEDRIKVFGQPGNLDLYRTVDFFGIAVQVHRKVANCLDAVIADLEAQGTTYQVREVGAYREERPDRPYFFHQYGGALDINPSTNPQCLADLNDGREGAGGSQRCDLAKPYDLPQEWIDTFARYGFYWGGNYSEGKDYMHFEWHGEKP